MWEGLTKKWGKTIKKISSPSVFADTRGRDASSSARTAALGEGAASPSARVRHSGNEF
jgi:hypothetical protein